MPVRVRPPAARRESARVLLHESEAMTVVLNVAAGTAEQQPNTFREQIISGFAAANVEVEVRSPDPNHSVADIVQEAMRNGDRAIIAAGGDGTVNGVASVLAGSDVVLGVLALGTLNHFAKDLSLPLDLEGAIATIAAGHTTAVDVAEVNGRVFVNNSSLGIYPRIVANRRAQQERLDRGKWPAFIWATLRAFTRFPFLDLRITIAEQQISRRTAFLFVGNNEYEIAGFRIGGRRSLERGMLGLYLTHRTGRFGLLRLAVRALFGRLNQAADFEAFTVTEATIESRRRSLLVATDGEVTRIETPLHYRTRPASLRVFVPNPAPAS